MAALSGPADRMTPLSDGTVESPSGGSRAAGSAACLQAGSARIILSKIIPNPLGGTVFLAHDPVKIQFQIRTYG